MEIDFLFCMFCMFNFTFGWNGFGSESAKMMPIRPDLDPALDPQHCQLLLLKEKGCAAPGVGFYF